VPDVLWCQRGLHQHRLSQTSGRPHAKWWITEDACTDVESWFESVCYSRKKNAGATGKCELLCRL
jgi:hypothetical protein